MVQNIEVGSLSCAPNNDCRSPFQGSKHCIHWFPPTSRYEEIRSQWCKSFCTSTSWCMGLGYLSNTSSEWNSIFRWFFCHIFWGKNIFSFWAKCFKSSWRIKEMLWKSRKLWSNFSMPILYQWVWKICCWIKLINWSLS